MSIIGLFGSVFIGTIVALVSSIFIQKEPNEDLFNDAIAEEITYFEKKASIGLLIAGYVFAILGGLIAIFIGQSLLHKIKLQNGMVVYKFDELSRNHGKTIRNIAIIAIVLYLLATIILSQSR